jgi:hypothetical protein
MFGIRVHVGIDGASHFVVYAKVATNKRAPTIYSGKRSSIVYYGIVVHFAQHNSVQYIFIPFSVHCKLCSI